MSMQQFETKSFVQQIKQKQEDFKKTITQNRSRDMSSSLTSPNQRRDQTPNQRKSKQESDNSCSPRLFRTPQISLHYDYRKQQQQHTRQPSNNRSRNENMSQMKEKRETTYFDTAVQADYQRTLDEVMKKYRIQQAELHACQIEVQKALFYKDEWQKEKVLVHYIKKRNDQLATRNKQLKNKLLKVIELVQKDQLNQEDESEVIIASLKQENQSLRKMLHIYDDVEDDVECDQYEVENDNDYVDSILNVFLGDLRTIQTKRKEKRECVSLGQFNSLSLTVLNKESSFVDLSEDKLLES